jgi:hypothetical protein
MMALVIAGSPREPLVKSVAARFGQMKGNRQLDLKLTMNGRVSSVQQQGFDIRSSPVSAPRKIGA